MRVPAVTNSTPIIALAFLDQLDLLGKLFEKVYVPRQVYNEVAADTENRIGADGLKKQIHEDRIVLYDIMDNNFVELMVGRLHKGELSVMIAAKELGITYVLMDDVSARKIAESYSLVPIGTVGILKLAKMKGLLSEVKSLLDKLVDNNFRISLKLYNEILKDVNEL